MDTPDGLVLDERLLRQLLDGDRLAGLGVRDPEAYSKVTSFYDRLSRRHRRAAPVVKILRTDTMRAVEIGIDLEKKVYFIPGA
jgi:hypothetical protein